MNILITGGKGFIGSHLVPKLKEKGHTVRVYDLIYGDDILNRTFLSEAIHKSDIVYHLAAKTSVPESFEKEEEYLETNIGGTLSVLLHCKKHGKKLIYTSSAAVYTPTSSPYAYSKYEAENIVARFFGSTMPITILRLFNVYGPGMNQAHPSVLLRFINENPITVMGDGTQTRDFIHVDDVTDIMIAALEKEWENKLVEVGTGIPHSIRGIAEIFQSYYGKEIKYVGTNQGVSHSIALTRNLKKLYKKPLRTVIEREIEKLYEEYVTAKPIDSPPGDSYEEGGASL